MKKALEWTLFSLTIGFIVFLLIYWAASSRSPIVLIALFFALWTAYLIFSRMPGTIFRRFFLFILGLELLKTPISKSLIFVCNGIKAYIEDNDGNIAWLLNHFDWAATANVLSEIYSPVQAWVYVVAGIFALIEHFTSTDLFEWATAKFKKKDLIIDSSEDIGWTIQTIKDNKNEICSEIIAKMTVHNDADNFATINSSKLTIEWFFLRFYVGNRVPILWHANAIAVDNNLKKIQAKHELEIILRMKIYGRFFRTLVKLYPVTKFLTLSIFLYDTKKRVYQVEAKKMKLIPKKFC